MIMSSGDPNQVYKAVQNLYVRAHSLMLKLKGYKSLLTLLSGICQCFENLTNLLAALDEQAVLNLNFSKDSIVVEKQLFEDHVERENLTNLLEDLDEQVVSNLNFSKDSMVIEKQMFEDHVQHWVKDTEVKQSESCFFS